MPTATGSAELVNRGEITVTGKARLMDTGIYELVHKILYGVSFIAIGGTLALIFFFVFAPSILGSRTFHKQLDKLQQQLEQMNEQLRRIASRLDDSGEDHK
ncbi:MAG: hypothetical protein ACYST6_03700 [Planctomycetota bacterium]|jgi:hypothetical protein